MTERIIVLDTIKPIDIFGINNEKFKLIKGYYPSLKIISRGDEVKINGTEEILDLFEIHFNYLLRYFEKHTSLPNSVIERIMLADHYPFDDEMNNSDVLVYGRNGKVIKAQTPNQKKLVESINKKDMIFTIGPAGSGKTYTAVALAVRALKNREVKRIILTRPAVEAGERLGFLPGDYKEKLDPYLRPLYDALNDMLPPKKLDLLIEEGIIEIAPLAFMRGRTLDHAFVILDEAQNTTPVQLKMFLTRMGKSAKFIINGDKTQIDLPRNVDSGLIDAENRLLNVKGIDFIFFNETDVIRHELVIRIIKAYNDHK